MSSKWMVSGSPAIVGASTSVAAFNITTQRGALNAPTAVTSFPQFVSRFGTYFPSSLGAYLVKGFFDNGGQTAYINRVVSSDASTGALSAAITLKDGATPAADTLKLNAGYRGVDDPGTWGSGLYVSVAATSETQVSLREIQAASITGTALSNTVDMTTVAPLLVTVDGEASPISLKFRAADFPGGLVAATPPQIRDAINRQTTKLVASLAANGLVLTSTGATARMNRDFTRIQVNPANAALGFSSTTTVVGTAAAHTQTATQLADVSPFAVGDALRLSDGTNNAFTKLMTVNPLTGDVTWQSVANIAAFDATKLRVSRVTFDLTIAYGGNDTAHVVETWNGLSMEPDAANNVKHVLNDKITGSKYVVASDLNRSDFGTDVPAPVSFAPFTPGRDGSPTPNDFIGDQAKHSGFYAFDAFDVQLLACERGDPAVTRAGARLLRRPRGLHVFRRRAAGISCKRTRPSPTGRRSRARRSTARCTVRGSWSRIRSASATTRSKRCRRSATSWASAPASPITAASGSLPPATRPISSERSTSNTGSATPNTPRWSSRAASTAFGRCRGRG